MFRKLKNYLKGNPMYRVTLIFLFLMLGIVGGFNYIEPTTGSRFMTGFVGAVLLVAIGGAIWDVTTKKHWD